MQNSPLKLTLEIDQSKADKAVAGIRLQMLREIKAVGKNGGQVKEFEDR
jgi:hypothetical protein